MKLRLLFIILFCFKSMHSFSLFDVENSQTLACELLLDCGNQQTNEAKYLECFKAFITMFPEDKFDNPQQFLADVLEFIKAVIQKNQIEHYNGIFRIGDSFELERAIGIHIGLLLEAGSDQEEQKHWNTMLNAIIELIQKNTNESHWLSFIDGLIQAIPPVIAPAINEDQFKEDSCGNRFKFNFNLC